MTALLGVLVLAVAAAIWIAGWALGLLAMRDDFINEGDTPILPLFGYGFWPIAFITVPAYGWWSFLSVEEIV